MHVPLHPKRGEIVAYWLAKEEIGILNPYQPEQDYTILESYNRKHPPITVNWHKPGRSSRRLPRQVRAGAAI